MKEKSLQKTVLATRQKRNEHGINIKECCASCRHMTYDKSGRRLCERGYGLVNISSVCESGANWEMRIPLDNAGAFSRAGIKSKEYLMFVLATLEEYWKTREGVERRRELGESCPIPRIPSVYELRQDYERQFKKSIYIK